MVKCAEQIGLGYIYGDLAVAPLIVSTLKPQVEGKDPMLVSSLWRRQMAALRNSGISGLGAMALSAVDLAIWNLKCPDIEPQIFVYARLAE